MRLVGSGSASHPARVVVDALLGIVSLLAGLDLLLIVMLLVDPLHPIREFFQVTTVATVPAEVWHTENLVLVEPGTASAKVDPWAYITYQPTSRAFVAATAAASIPAWVCVLLVLLNLRRAFANVAAGTPFPRENIRCIRTAGWAVLGYAAVQVLIDVAMVGYMHATTTVAGQPPAIPRALLIVDFPLGTILAGLAVVVLADVFRAGADLQDEQALTI